MTEHTTYLDGGQSPPCHEDSEYAAVGCALIDPTGYALRTMATIIDADDFLDGRARIVYRACLDVLDAHGIVDVVLVHDYLCETGQLSEIGGPLTLDWYGSAVSHTAHAEHYARVVAKNAIRRAAYHQARDLTIAALEAHESIDALRERVRALAALLDGRKAALRPADRDRGGLQ